MIKIRIHSIGLGLGLLGMHAQKVMTNFGLADNWRIL